MASAGDIKKGYERFLNQTIKVIYYDSPDHATTKIGTLVSCDNDSVVLFELTARKEILIPKYRIVRVELEEVNR